MSNSARHRITPQRGRRIQAGAKVPATGSYIRQSAEGAADRNHSVALLGLPCGCILLQGLHPCLCSDTPSGLFRTTRDTQSPPLALPARGGETTPCHLFRFKGRVFACQIPRNTGHTTSCHFRNLTSKFPTVRCVFNTIALTPSSLRMTQESDWGEGFSLIEKKRGTAEPAFAGPAVLSCVFCCSLISPDSCAAGCCGCQHAACGWPSRESGVHARG